MNDVISSRTTDLSTGVDLLAAELENMLPSLGHPDLLAPHREDYRIRPGRGGEPAMEVELHLAFGAMVNVVVPFSCDADDVGASVAELHERLVKMLADIDALLALRDEVDDAARKLMRRAARSGIRGRVLDVRLSAIDLVTPAGLGAVTVTIEGEACNVLRPFEDEWHVRSLDDLEQRFAGFRERQHRWAPLRRAARAQGAIGFIDPLALAVADALPEGRQTALRTIARELERAWYLDRGDGQRPEMVGLTWHDGVVYPCMRLNDEIKLSGEAVYIRDAEIDEAAAGQPIDTFVSHPALTGRVIAAVPFARPGFAEIRLDRQLLPFTAAGEVLPG